MVYSSRTCYFITILYYNYIKKCGVNMLSDTCRDRISKINATQHTSLARLFFCSSLLARMSTQRVGKHSALQLHY